MVDNQNQLLCHALATYSQYDTRTVEKFLRSFDEDDYVEIKNKEAVYVNLFSLSRYYKYVLTSQSNNLGFVLSFTDMLKGSCECFPSFKEKFIMIFFDLYNGRNIDPKTKFSFHPVDVYIKNPNL